MLPKIFNQSYQNFFNALLKFRDHVMEENLDIAEVQKIFQQVQKIFQEEILSLTTQELDPAFISPWQSVQTEIHRTLRLLGTDLLFLQSSKQQGTVEQRLKAIRDRIEQLISYCQAILKS